MDFRRWIENMRTRTALVLFLVSVALGGVLVFVIGVSAAEKSSKHIEEGKAVGEREAHSNVEWRKFGEGLDEADNQEKKILVDVYTDWCGWCKRMDKSTYTDAAVLEYLDEKFIPVKMNAESRERAEYFGDEYSYRQIASGFKVTGYPTTLFLDSDGKHITTVPGYMKPGQFLAVLRYIGEEHYKDKSFQEFREEQEAAQE